MGGRPKMLQKRLSLKQKSVRAFRRSPRKDLTREDFSNPLGWMDKNRRLWRKLVFLLALFEIARKNLKQVKGLWDISDAI